jgi:hypothetical protein
MPRNSFNDTYASSSSHHNDTHASSSSHRLDSPGNGGNDDVTAWQALQPQQGLRDHSWSSGSGSNFADHLQRYGYGQQSETPFLSSAGDQYSAEVDHRATTSHPSESFTDPLRYYTQFDQLSTMSPSENLQLHNYGGVPDNTFTPYPQTGDSSSMGSSSQRREWTMDITPKPSRPHTPTESIVRPNKRKADAAFSDAYHSKHGYSLKQLRDSFSPHPRNAYNNRALRDYIKGEGGLSKKEFETVTTMYKEYFSNTLGPDYQSNPEYQKHYGTLDGLLNRTGK